MPDQGARDGDAAVPETIAGLPSAMRACGAPAGGGPAPPVRAARRADRAALLSAFAGGQTSPVETAFLMMHLAACERCRRTLLRYAETRSLLERMGCDDWAPPDLRLRVLLACRAL